MVELVLKLQKSLNYEKSSCTESRKDSYLYILAEEPTINGSGTIATSGDLLS